MQFRLRSLYNGRLPVGASGRLNRRENWTITRGCRFNYGDISMATSKSASRKTASKKKNAAAKSASKAPARKSTAKKAAKKAAARKPAVKKTSAKKTTAKKTPARKSAAKKTAGKKSPARKTSAKKTSAKKTSAKKTSAKKSPARKAAAGKPAAGKAGKAAASKSRATAGKGKGRAVLTKPADNTITREGGRYALPSNVEVDLAKNYRPTAREEYMGPKQLAYFRAKLRDWRDQLVEESRQTMDNLREEVRDVGDEAERATRETENSLELRTRDRYRKLIAKIDKALRRIEDGSYGYCEETDEEIGIDRLDARPIATLSLDAQERREHLRKQMGD